MSLSRLIISSPTYTARLAATEEEIRAAQELRYRVFNVELKEGLSTAEATCRDADPFDEVCDHLIVEHLESGRIVGTYRVQTGMSAARRLGYYAAREFDLSAFDGLRAETLELGRACVERSHRNLVVLGLLWKQISDYCRERGLRYLIGCSSALSNDPRIGASLYDLLSTTHLAPAERQAPPLPSAACPLEERSEVAPSVPKLLKAYLCIGATICGPPAIDAEFGTIDFLTFLDLDAVPEETRRRFMG